MSIEHFLGFCKKQAAARDSPVLKIHAHAQICIWVGSAKLTTVSLNSVNILIII